MLEPRKWADPGTVEVFIDHVEGPHRSGAGDLWDVDKFWVQIGWEGYGFVRTHVHSARACDGDTDENSTSGVSVGIVGERLVLPLFDFEETGANLQASLHEADVVCKTSTEVASCMVPVDRSRSSIPWYYMLRDWGGNVIGILHLSVSLPEFPEHPASSELRRGHFSETNRRSSLHDFWTPLLQIVCCGCDSNCEQSPTKHVIVRKDINKQYKPSNSLDGHLGYLGPMDSAGTHVLTEMGQM